MFCDNWLLVKQPFHQSSTPKQVCWKYMGLVYLSDKNYGDDFYDNIRGVQPSEVYSKTAILAALLLNIVLRNLLTYYAM
jgi:hypothetical protein